ncbi:uncharacterized protein LOC132203249 isoform X2 [Neocloeon triangulifer]|uniref:uncharacterized protein LOC132203249 isoform X2 n=1 Tax=Neocloeon triangulifer TaxID=2078957 RepID=UPI00286F603B|nr:uncharacterized protein LOC132203249 isoform X2 [Neocloeon triangulifer]
MAKELHTEDSNDYEFNEVSTTSSKCVLRFKVKAAHDAHVCLSSTEEQDATPFLEVFIGGWDNSKCAIRRDRAKPDRAEAETPDVLSADEFRGFWISWDSEGKIEVGREGEEEAFLSYVEPEPFEITHYGVRTAWGANGDWEIEKVPEPEGDDADGEEKETAEEKEESEADLEPAETPGEACWVAATNGEVPEGAVCGGTDLECDLMIARAVHEGELLPGKFVPAHGVTYVSWNGAEHAKEEYEMLCGCKPVWFQINQGDTIPENALPGGRTAEGETLFIGRVPHEGTVTVGKVHPSHGTCYIPYAGQELGFPDFEVLVRQ